MWNTLYLPFWVFDVRNEFRLHKKRQQCPSINPKCGEALEKFDVTKFSQFVYYIVIFNKCNCRILNWIKYSQLSRFRFHREFEMFLMVLCIFKIILFNLQIPGKLQKDMLKRLSDNPGGRFKRSGSRLLGDNWKKMELNIPVNKKRLSDLKQSGGY